MKLSVGSISKMLVLGAVVSLLGACTSAQDRTSYGHSLTTECMTPTGDGGYNKRTEQSYAHTMAPVQGDALVHQSIAGYMTGAAQVSGLGIAPWFNKFRSNTSANANVNVSGPAPFPGPQ